MRLPLPKTRKGRWILVAITLLVAAGGVGAWYLDSRWPWYHFHTIVDGELYRAGQPSPEDVATAKRRYGVKTLVNLRAERAPELEPERIAAQRSGIQWVDLPIPEGQPPNAEQVAQLLALYDDPARRPILFHCQYGSIRSAAVEALYRIEVLGESSEEALDRTRTFGHDLEGKYPAIPAFLRSYVPRRARTGASGASPAGGR